MGKDTCDGRRSFNIQFLKKHSYLDAGMHSGTIWWRNEHAENSICIFTNISDHNSLLTLDYSWIKRDDTKVPMKYTVTLVSTSCNFGGKRWWFICPLTCGGVVCNRRVSKLYSLGQWFGCRRCGGFAYDSQYERRNGYFGALGRYFKLTWKMDEMSPPRIKSWRGRATRRYQKYLAMRMQAYDAADIFVTQSEKMDRWLNRKKTVE
jgi:hypothetical protein